MSKLFEKTQGEIIDSITSSFLWFKAGQVDDDGVTKIRNYSKQIITSSTTPSNPLTHEGTTQVAGDWTDNKGWFEPAVGSDVFVEWHDTQADYSHAIASMFRLDDLTSGGLLLNTWVDLNAAGATVDNIFSWAGGDTGAVTYSATAPGNNMYGGLNWQIDTSNRSVFKIVAAGNSVVGTVDDVLTGTALAAGKHMLSLYIDVNSMTVQMYIDGAVDGAGAASLDMTAGGYSGRLPLGDTSRGLRFLAKENGFTGQGSLVWNGAGAIHGIYDLLAMRFTTDQSSNIAGYISKLYTTKIGSIPVTFEDL